MKKMNLLETQPIPDKQGKVFIYESIGLTAAIWNDQLSVARTRMEPDSVAERHFHNYSKEIYIMVEGNGVLVLNEESIPMAKGDVVLIEPPEKHHLVSHEEPLELIVITLPAYTPDDYIVASS